MRKGVRVVIVLVAVLVSSAARCGPTAQNVARSGDDLARLGKAASVADDLSRAAAAAARSSANVDNGLAAAASSIPIEGSSDEVAKVKGALKTIAWQAFCDVIDGKLTADPEAVASWIDANAWSFGLALAGEADLSLAGGVIDQFRAYPNVEAPSTCEQLTNSGL